MKIILNKDTFKIEEQNKINSGSVKYYEVDIEHDEAWNDLTIVAIIQNVDDDKGVPTSVINNKLYIDKMVSGKYFIGFIGYILSYALTEDTAIDTSKKYYTRSGEEGSYVYTLVEEPNVEEILTYYEATKEYQISTKLDKIKFDKGAGEIELTEDDIPRIDEWEIYIEQIQNMINEIKELPSYDITSEDIANWNNKVTDDDYVHTDNNFTDEEKEKLAELENYDDTSIRNELANKVDKETGKGLSTNDFTTTEKTKLAGLENYNDTELRQRVTNAEDDIDDLETTVARHTTQIGEIEAEIPEAIGEHNQSTTSHLDIRQLIALINALIPTQATAQNQLGDKDFINSSINSITAFYITKNANGEQFNSKAELDSSTVFYSGGEVRVPTRNDYCIVLEDETKDNATTRYIYQNGQWEFQYTVNETALTAEQLAAINSGITQTLVGQISTNQTNIQTLNGNKEDKSNKVTSVSSASTNQQYPSAKAVYDYIESLDIEEVDF